MVMPVSECLFLRDERVSAWIGNISERQGYMVSQECTAKPERQLAAAKLAGSHQ